MATNKKPTTSQVADSEEVILAQKLREKVWKFNEGDDARAALAPADETALDAIVEDANGLLMPNGSLVNPIHSQAKRYAAACRARIEITLNNLGELGDPISTPAIENPAVRRAIANEGRKLLSEIDGYIERSRASAQAKRDYFTGQVAAIAAAMNVPYIRVVIETYVILMRDPGMNRGTQDDTYARWNAITDQVREAMRRGIPIAKQLGDLPGFVEVHTVDQDKFLQAYDAWQITANSAAA